MTIRSAFHQAALTGKISSNPLHIDFTAVQSYKTEQLSGIMCPSPIQNFTPIDQVMRNVRPAIHSAFP
jgi:hypothetical protein